MAPHTPRRARKFSMEKCVPTQPPKNNLTKLQYAVLILTGIAALLTIVTYLYQATQHIHVMIN